MILSTYPSVAVDGPEERFAVYAKVWTNSKKVFTHVYTQDWIFNQVICKM